MTCGLGMPLPHTGGSLHGVAQGFRWPIDVVYGMRLGHIPCEVATRVRLQFAVHACTDGSDGGGISPVPSKRDAPARLARGRRTPHETWRTSM